MKYKPTKNLHYRAKQKQSAETFEVICLAPDDNNRYRLFQVTRYVGINEYGSVRVERFKKFLGCVLMWECLKLLSYFIPVHCTADDSNKNDLKISRHFDIQFIVYFCHSIITVAFENLPVNNLLCSVLIKRANLIL